MLRWEGGKPLGGIKSMYVHSLGWVRVKLGGSGRFRIDTGVRQGHIMSPCLFNMYMDSVMKEMEMGMRRRGESGDYLASCMQMTWFCVVSRRRT